jgi:hypothetical protein
LPYEFRLKSGCRARYKSINRCTGWQCNANI